MSKVSVELSSPTHYAEPDSKAYRFKRKLTLKPILSIIRKFLKNKDDFSLLEVGTGSGFLLTFLEAEFPKAKLKGLEYDNRLVSLTQSKLKNAKIFQGNAEEFNFEGETFDMIVSLQVIEHLYKPELLIASAKKHLKPGGIFMFTTPNPKSISARVMKDKWHGYRDDHVSMKSCDEWVALAEGNGFKTLYAGSTFFTGIPVLNKLPLGIFNWGLLFLFGTWKWKQGESFVGVFRK